MRYLSERSLICTVCLPYVLEQEEKKRTIDSLDRKRRPTGRAQNLDSGALGK